MSNPESPDEADALSESDDRLFRLLDDYVENLHQEDIPSRSVMLERHPELQELMHCLESLDSLAIPADVLREEPSSHEDALLPAENGSDSERTVAWSAKFDEEDSTCEPRAGLAPTKHQQFGKYQLLEELGRGGMGVVYRAWQSDLRRHVAIKMILQSRLASADDVRRFSIEAQSAGGLSHTGIVGIHEVGEHAGQHYYTMEYVDGENLAECLKRGSLSAEKAARCVESVARAVHYLHTYGVIHRDLKPSNILLDANGVPQVTDFGLAKIFDETDSGKTQSGTIIGTPSYMSPEQAAGHASQVSPACDVYSLGAILYELICGRPPFQRDTPLDTLVEVIEGEPAPLRKRNPQVPRDLELICLKCLEKDPTKRYGSAEDLANDLERFLRGEAIEARPSDIFAKIRRWARRQPTLASRLGCILVTAGIVHVRYLLDPEIPPGDVIYHWQIMGLFGLLAVLAGGFQWMMNRDSLENIARFGWAGADVVVLTALLYLAGEPIGPILIGYPLIIAAAGLFFMVRLVLFTTVFSLLAFAVLVMARPEITQTERPHYLIIFAGVLLVQGLVTAHQVYRVRALSRFYEQRRV